MGKRSASPTTSPTKKGTSSKRPKVAGLRLAAQNGTGTTPRAPSASRSVLSLVQGDDITIENLAVHLFNTGQVDIEPDFDPSEDALASPEINIKDEQLSPAPFDAQTTHVKDEPVSPSLLAEMLVPMADWWAPLEHQEYTEDDPQYKLFRSRTVFESDDLAPENYMRKPTVELYDWVKEMKGDVKPRDPEQPKGKKVKSSGYHVISDSLKPRHSATQKYLKWRTTNFPNDRPSQKAPRDILLLEHEPLGVIGEAGAWGNSYSTLAFNANLARGSKVVLRIGVGDNALNTCGASVEFHKAIMAMLEKWTSKPSASTIFVDFEDDGILRTNIAALYPPLLVEFDERKEKIDEDIARARKFVNDIRYFQNTRLLPPKPAATKRGR
ncbi:hypothetical protein BDV96DRAFT_634069 [Lophiotrema nucula]|uniref:Uncharacterized protein n=1 Tax=Lophiotrema nucula TaxID=690887 RepID=A0A6A5YZU9_9PLEO|nr:hypothetical protein BDV96DRAFT_634069 [Lophiotrema nucula]